MIYDVAFRRYLTLYIFEALLPYYLYYYDMNVDAVHLVNYFAVPESYYEPFCTVTCLCVSFIPRPREHSEILCRVEALLVHDLMKLYLYHSCPTVLD